MRKMNNRGDTIIEVMISLAVLGLVIAGAYGIANRSLKGIRAAQEREEALKIAEGQVEKLKENASGNKSFLSQNNFCIINTTTTSSAGSPQCKYSNLYNVKIDKSGNDFTATITWDRIGGGSQENLTLAYRLY